VIDSTGPINYATSALYTPSGELSIYTNGFVSGGFAGYTMSNTYNNRLQPLLLSVASPTASILSLCYDFHEKVNINMQPCVLPASSTGDNGNVFRIANNRDGNRTQNFDYDNLNRIQHAYTSGPSWGEAFTIDAWGNLTNRAAYLGKTQYEPLDTPALATNQLTGFGYDAAGNLTANGTTGYNYDSENRMTKFVGDTTDIYLYDGDGQRVKKNASAVTLYWFGATDNVLDETNSSGALNSEYIFFNGQRIARRDADNSVKYYFSEHLGSASVIADDHGTVKEESDYYPYGGEVVITSNDPNHYKFTGKERDSESGLDEFGARYYASSLGRFMIPDWAAKPTSVPYANFGNPQSLNLYSYVQNNPTTFGDPDGHLFWDWPQGGVKPSQVEQAAEAKNLTEADVLSGHGGDRNSEANMPNVSSNDNYHADFRDGATITYSNGVPPMQPKTQQYVQQLANDAGADSINIYATTNGKHDSPLSNHYNGTAVDINKVNGEPVMNAATDPAVAANVRSIQNTANSKVPGVAHENYGPAGLYKNGRQITNQKLQAEHENHIHITIPRVPQ
jgi:RHS repeat-associated protein